MPKIETLSNTEIYGHIKRQKAWEESYRLDCATHCFIATCKEIIHDLRKELLKRGVQCS